MTDPNTQRISVKPPNAQNQSVKPPNMQLDSVQTDPAAIASVGSVSTPGRSVKPPRDLSAAHK